MSTPWADLDVRIRAALAADPSRVPVVVGSDRSGRTSLLRRLAETGAPRTSQYVDLERVTSTPERFFASVLRETPFRVPPLSKAVTNPRAAMEGFFDVITRARTAGGEPATFLLDEWLEFRTFEHFPGLRQVVREVTDRIAASPNRLVVTTRFVARALRLLEGAPDRLVVVSMPSLSVPDIAADLLHVPGYRSDLAEEFAHTVLALTGGRAGDVRVLVDALLAAPSLGDPVSAMVACMAPGASLDVRCRYAYEYRLHRARGYGALKAVLGILAAEEPLTLTEIAVRLGRTPGSTRDYLWWLEDVDLVVAHRKQYAFADPVLRLWASLFDRPSPADDEARAVAIQRYALARLSELPGR